MIVKCPKCDFSQETAVTPKLINKGARQDHLFNFGFNEEIGENYCDLFDWGIHRVWRDVDKKIIRIDLIKDGVFVSLKEEKK